MFFDKPETQERISDTGALGEPATFLERTKAALDAATDRNVLNASGKLLGDAYKARIDAIRSATGDDLSSFNPMSATDGGTMVGFEPPGQATPQKTPQQKAFEFQQELERLAQKKPEFRDIIAPHKPVHSEVARGVQEREQRSTDAGRNYGGITGTGPIADFAGGIGAQALDPVNAMTMVLGPWGRAGQGAKAILAMGVKQGLANAGVEAAMAPLVQDFRRQMGLSYGVSEAAMDIAAAGALGFVFDAGGRSIVRGGQAALGRKAILDVDGNVKGYESAEKAAARAKRDEEARIKAEQLKALQDDGTLAKALEGDPDAIAKVDPILGLSEDPAVRGAMQARGFIEMEPGEVEGIVKARNLEQALRATFDPDEPSPVIRIEAPSKRPSLSDEMEIPKGTDGNQHYRSLDVEGKPVRFQNIDPKQLTTDAETFQFKSGADARGVTGSLGLNTTFDPAGAGRVIVFERGDGVMVIVDGHQRLSIAKDGDQFQGFVFREADGWTPNEVRAEAALKNIQEGRAPLMDTVRAIREHGEAFTGRLDDGTDFMRQAMALSHLSDSALARVEAGTIEPNMAALVGELVPEQTKHDGVVQALMRANPSTEAAARKIIGREIREPVTAEEQARVLGASVAEPHVIEARADVLAGVLTTLRGEPGYIGEVETQAVAKVISRLADRAGLVADTLSQAGRAVAEGQPLERAIDATLRRFEQVIAEAGVKGLSDQPVRLASISEARKAEIRAYHGTGNSFETFRIPRDAIGLHFGTSEQASKRLIDINEKYRDEGTHNPGGFLDGARIIPVDLDFKRSLMLPDLGSWSARTVAKAVSTADAKLSGLFDEVVAMQKLAVSERRSKIAADRAALDLVRAKLIAAGYDSIVYENTVEGPGLSYIALRNGTVRNAHSGEVLFALSDVDTGRSMRRDLDALGYYSKALEAAKAIPQAKGTPEQMLAALKKAGVKNAEIEATNLAQFLDGKKSITRDEIVKHLTENRVGVQQKQYAGEAGYNSNRSIGRELMNRAEHYQEPDRSEMIATARRMMEDTEDRLEPDDFSDYGSVLDEIQEIIESTPKRGKGVVGPAKWQNHSLDPSNPTYRETVLHLPTPEMVTIEEFAKAERKMFPDASDAEIRSAWDGMTYRTREKHIRDINTDFQSGHFSEPNIIGHMMTSMTKHEGKPVYTIDQIQSDWGQKLRDGGVRDEAKIAELKARISEENKRSDAVAGPLAAELDALGVEPYSTGRPTTDVFMRTTRFKNELREAERRGDSAKIGELIGAADRVDAIRREYDKLRQPYSLLEAELRTAEAATPGHPLVNTTDQWTITTLRRALRQAAEADAEFIAIPHGDTVLSYNPGDAKGMRGFYGSDVDEGIVPKNLRKLLEKMDKDAAKPTKVEKLETSNGLEGWQGESDYGNNKPKNGADANQTGFTLFPLTDKVKRSVMEEGQPLFAKQDAPQNIDQKALQDFSDNLETVLREAQQPSPPRLVSDLKDAKAHTEELRETMAQEIKEATDPVTAEAARLAAIRAFHGSPHDFDKFDLSRIGTGEGAQAFGHGLYFAESEGVARFYQESLGDYKDSVKWKGDKPPTPMQESLIGRLMGPDVRSGSMMTVQKLRRELNYGLMDATDGMFPDAKRAQRYRAELAELDKIEPMIEVTPPGRMYEVNIKADPEDFLDWDKPLLQQSEKVRGAVAKLAHIDPGLNGNPYPGRIINIRGLTPDKASAALREAGIPGIRYLDQGSRGAGEGSRNYVVFDDSLIEIVAKDGKPITPEQKKTLLASMRDEQAAERAARQQPAMIDPSKPLLYTAKANELQAEIRKEIDRTIQMLPPDVRIRVEDQLVFSGLDAPDQRIAGLWDGYDRLVYVAMSGADPVRAIRHEVIHALKQSKLLTDDEFNQLYAFAEKLKLRKAYGIDGKYRDLYTKAYGERGGDYVESLLREETVAEMFADYSINGRRFGDVAGGGLVDRLIDRIVAFMKVMRDNLGFIGFKNINDIFQAIESGEVAARPSSRNPAGGRNPDVVARQIGEAMGGGDSRMASMDGQRPSEMLDQALAALPEETSTAIRNLLRQANIDEAQLGGMLDQLMPMIRSGDQQAIAARVQDMAQEAQQAMPLPDTPFARDLASVRSDMEMTDVIGICKL